MSTKTLKQWLSDQQAPPHIQAKLEELFRLPDGITNFTDPRIIKSQLSRILDE